MRLLSSYVLSSFLTTARVIGFTLNPPNLILHKEPSTIVSSKIKLYSTQGNQITDEQNNNNNRRKFLHQSILTTGALCTGAFTREETANAADDDMTTQMFNEDGSLKEGALKNDKVQSTEVEAQSTEVSVLFPMITSADDNKQAIVSVDGASITSSAEGDDASSSSSSLPKIKSSYNIPNSWTSAPEYLDTLLSVRQKACDHITVYQVPGTFKDNSILEKATTIGVGKALNFASISSQGVFPKTLLSADIISGRKVVKALSSREDESEKKQQKYYEFDLAVAPDTCGQSAENLNLGFCPYDTIVLISATIVDQKMMVCGVSCTKDEWKRANADLKRVRNSFFVESV